MNDTDLCAYSDLTPDACAHCRGNTRIDGEPTPVTLDPAPAVVVWSPSKARQDAQNAAGRPLGVEVGQSAAVVVSGPQNANACRCGRPVRDTAVICDGCANELRLDLAEAGWVTDELDITMTRQRSIGTEGGSASASTPLPWHDKAAEATRNLHNLLVLWVRLCHEERVGGPSELPADNNAALATWLTQRLDALAHHDAAAEAHHEITEAMHDARRIIFWKRKSRTYLGACEQTVVDDEGYVIHEKCDGDVYADPDAAVGHCDDCGHGFTVVIRKGEIERQLDDRLCTPSEIARYAVHLGLSASRDQVRRRVNYWHRHKRIIQRGTTEDGWPTFRYGEVRAMLYAEFASEAS